MAKLPGLFDVEERLRRLSDIGDQLEAFSTVVDFEMFRPELDAALSYSDGAKGGRPPFDPVMMFKILVIQAQNGLSDDRTEFLINDRLSFMRFLGLGLSDKAPDAKTIWAFRERLTQAGAIDPPPLKWSALRYAFWQQGGRIRCPRRDTSTRRLSRSCGRLTFSHRKAGALPMRSARSG